MSTFQSVTFREYLRIYFRHKTAMFLVFSIIMAALFFTILFKTPVYEAQVTLLITAQKKIEAYYYQDAGNAYGSGESTVALTQSEIMSSTPVLERAVKVLKLYKRPVDYERKFASPFKIKVQDQLKAFKHDLRELAKKPSVTVDDDFATAIRGAVEGLRENLEIAPIKNTNLLSLTIKDYDPVEAARIANVISRSFVIFDLEQQLAEYQLKYGETHQIVQQLSADVDRLVKRILSEPRSNIESIGPASTKIIAAASIPLKPKKFLGEKIWLPVLVVIFFAAFVSVLVALVLDFLDQSFKSPQEVKAEIKIPYLGFLPRKSWLEAQIIKRFSTRSLYDKAYAKLAGQIRLLIKGRNAQTILVTSTLSREGANQVVANLGLAFSEEFAQPTLIIDANLHVPTLAKLFNLSESAGLAEVLSEKESLEKVLLDLKPNLKLLCAGSSRENSMALLSSAKLAEVLQWARKKFQLVIINTPSALEYKDAELISTLVDAGIYVISEGKTRRQVVMHAIDDWGNMSFDWLGVILNNRRLAIPGIIYKWT